MAIVPSGLDLMPGFRVRVVDANLQGRKAALQFDGAAFGAFSCAELGLDSPVDLKSKPGRWKFVGSERHIDVPIGDAISYCESGLSGKGDRPTSGSDFRPQRPTKNN
jgi:hypothetical protein